MSDSSKPALLRPAYGSSMTDWNAITTALTVILEGDPTTGAPRLRALWATSDPAEHAQRCVMAHYLADLETDLDEEVRWDECALEEFTHVFDTDLTPVGITSAAGLAPSLHLNLGDGYLRQGHFAQARKQLELGRAAAGVLGNDGYGTMIRKGLDGLGNRLDGIDRARKD